MPPKRLKAKQNATPNTKANPLNWPPLHPLVPSIDLTFETLLPDQIILIPQFWTKALCKSYVSFLSKLPFVTTPSKPKKGDAVRVNDRYQIDDPAFAKRLWEETALKDLVLGTNEHDNDGLTESERRSLWGGEVVGLNPNIRIYRYKKGQFFAQHYDDSNTFSIPSSSSEPSETIPVVTTYTLLLYLTTPPRNGGGETVFYPQSSAAIPVYPEAGTALLHRHGRDCLPHEGLPVTGDVEKWVLRSDLCVRL